MWARSISRGLAEGTGAEGEFQFFPTAGMGLWRKPDRSAPDHGQAGCLDHSRSKWAGLRGDVPLPDQPRQLRQLALRSEPDAQSGDDLRRLGTDPGLSIAMADLVGRLLGEAIDQCLTRPLVLRRRSAARDRRQQGRRQPPTFGAAKRAPMNRVGHSQWMRQQGLPPQVVALFGSVVEVAGAGLAPFRDTSVISAG